MYKTNDYVVYAKTGICKIKDIRVPKEIGEADRLYYILEPLGDSCVIYAPVDTKAFIRPVISAREAQRLIDEIPRMPAKAYYNHHLQELAKHYEDKITGYACADLVMLARSIYAKKQAASLQNQKLGQTDEKYLKQAEDLLMSEFSVALGIAKQEVPNYIASRIENPAAPSPRKP